MSGDVQPRKRKDKRRKKEGGSLGNIHDVPGSKIRGRSSEEEREDTPIRSTDNGENIHVHHDHGMGGNVFFKIIFFALLAVLLGLVGLIFIESRGSTDVDLPSIEDSRFAEYFTGWLDDSPDEHGHDDHPAASGEDGEHDDDDDDHNEDQEEADHSENQEESDDHDDDEGHSEDDEKNDKDTEEKADEDDDDNESDATKDVDDDDDSVDAKIRKILKKYKSGKSKRVTRAEPKYNPVTVKKVITKTQKYFKDDIKNLNKVVKKKKEKYYVDDDDDDEGKDSGEEEGKDSYDEDEPVEEDNKRDEKSAESDDADDDDDDNDNDADEDNSAESNDADDDDDNESENNDIYKEDDHDDDDEEDDDVSSEGIDGDRNTKIESGDEEGEVDDDLDLTQEGGSDEEGDDSINKNKSDVADDSEEEGESNDEDEAEGSNEEEAEGSNEENDATEDDHSKTTGSAMEDSLPDDEEFVEEIEESEEALKEEEEALKKEEEALIKAKLDELGIDDDIDSEDDVKVRKKKEKALQKKIEKLLKQQAALLTEGDEEAVDDAGEEDAEAVEDADEEDTETGGVAVKLGVGVALIIVAHLVVVRKWRALPANPPNAGEDIIENVTETTESKPEETEEELIISRRQTLIPDNLHIEHFDDEELDEEEYSEEELEPEIRQKTIEDIRKERQDPTKYYTKEELGDSEDLEEEEELQDEEIEEEEIEESSITPSEHEDDEEELLDEEEEEEEDDWRGQPSAPQPPIRRGGPLGLNDIDTSSPDDNDEPSVQVEPQIDSNGDENDEPSEEITDKKSADDDDDDWLFRQELDFADQQFDNNPQESLRLYSTILSKNGSVISALMGKARALDKLAELQRDNKLLSQAISTYVTLISLHGSRLNDSIFKHLSERCIDRMRFAGKLSQAISIHKEIIKRFPSDPSHRNTLAVSYLILNQIKLAKQILEEVLTKWPTNGFAQVHLGFILKTNGDNLTDAVKLLQSGIQSEEPGVIDGRFFFHLGDALNRLGRSSEAMEVYQLGVQKGLFNSKYQRSLYNVNRLKAKPWWSQADTTYSQFFTTLEKSWKSIRDEGLALLNAKDVKLFKDEAESLKDTGDWKQLDLFYRGRKQPSCDRAPITCNLIAAFLPASTCTRGQAKFSVMFPDTHVWPHCGPTNCRLRSHLGLVVPPKTFLRVAEETKSWKEGKVLIFDDSFEHEVWHNGSSPRLVLIVDVWHPELTHRERQTLSPI